MFERELVPQLPQVTSDEPPCSLLRRLLAIPLTFSLPSFFLIPTFFIASLPSLLPFLGLLHVPVARDFPRELREAVLPPVQEAWVLPHPLLHLLDVLETRGQAVALPRCRSDAAHARGREGGRALAGGWGRVPGGVG